MSGNEYRILVTGATGVVGSLVVDALEKRAKAGARVDGKLVVVVGATRSAASKAAMESNGRRGVLLDLDKPGTFAEVLAGFNAVFLATGYTGSMCQQSKWFTDACIAAGITHLVHLGARHAAPGHMIHLTWHDLVEAYIEFKMPGKFTMLHPAFFMENAIIYDRRPFIKDGVVSWPWAGDSPMLWISSRDTAEVAAIALLDPSSHSGKTYTLGTQVATIGEACAEFSSVVGKQISFELRDGAAIYAEALRETPEDAGRLAYLKCISEMSIAAQKAYKERLDKGVKPDPALFPKPCPDVEELLGRKPEDLKAFAEANKEAFLN